MPLILVYDDKTNEIRLIRDQVANLSDKELSFLGASTYQELVAQLERALEVNIFCADFTLDLGESIRCVRRQSPESLVVVIADEATPPTLYVRPEILPSGLLLRPLSEEKVYGVFDEVLAEVFKQMRTRENNNEVFIAATRSETIRIPYSQILFFEARNKKIVVCTARSEIGFYSTLDSLSERLPKYFLRCHKGYLINTLLVNKVDFGNSTLHLIGGYEIPISRSYRAAVKEGLT